MSKLGKWHGSFKYFLVIALVFSVFVLVSLVFNIRQIRKHAAEKALAEANAIFDLNLAYRRWNAGHGGVYVPVTDKYQPSPYLSVHPKRDIKATDGTVLTVVNPAIMTRNVHEILSKSSSLPIMNKVTSLKYINPENKPDEWEEKALRMFDQGSTEASEIVQVKGQPYMRLLKPYYTEEGCLMCHAWQGYKKGDIRGGLSVGVPMQPYLEIAAQERRQVYFSHILIWLMGMTGTTLLGLLLNRAEGRVVENEWKFRTLAESSSDWEYWLDDDGKIIFMSPSSRQITGYGPSEFAEDPSLISRIIHPEDTAVWSAHLCDAGDRLHKELACRIVTKDGEVRWLSHNCDPIDINDRSMGRRVSNRDITSRIKSEEALKKWAHIFEHAEWGVVVGSAQGDRLELMNPAFARMHGYAVDELQGCPVAVIFPPEALSDIRKQIEIALEKGHHTFECEHLRKDGSVFPVKCDMTAVKDGEGRVLYTVVNVQDVTESRKIEARYLQAQKMESIGRLSAGIAHDFNNYLSVITGYAEMVLMEASLDSPTRQRVQTIFDAGTKAAVIARQLLAFSRKQVLERKPHSLNTIVSDILKILGKMVGEDVKIQTDLKAQDAAMVDRGQVEQVIMNLAANARDAMPRGGALIIETSDIRVDRLVAERHADVDEGDYVMLAVTDSGEGMSKEVLARIFEPFFTTKQMGRGTGLGLATVHGIVKQHKGYIDVYSEIGRGTTFKIYFPASKEAVSKAVRAETAEMKRGTEKVLIVDDEDSVRNLISDILTPLGYRCLLAANGAEALHIAESVRMPIDLLLTDIVMPDMSGRDLAEIFALRFPAAKVLYMSGYTENVIIHHGILDEGISFIAKPISPRAMAGKVREVLDS